MIFKSIVHILFHHQSSQRDPHPRLPHRIPQPLQQLAVVGIHHTLSLLELSFVLADHSYTHQLVLNAGVNDAAVFSVERTIWSQLYFVVGKANFELLLLECQLKSIDAQKTLVLSISTETDEGVLAYEAEDWAWSSTLQRLVVHWVDVEGLILECHFLDHIGLEAIVCSSKQQAGLLFLERDEIGDRGGVGKKRIIIASKVNYLPLFALKVQSFAEISPDVLVRR